MLTTLRKAAKWLSVRKEELVVALRRNESAVLAAPETSRAVVNADIAVAHNRSGITHFDLIGRPKAY